MSAREFQLEIKKRLERHFSNSVIIEWPITKGASDLLGPDDSRYSPRVDVAVYTIGNEPGNHLQGISDFWEKQSPEKIKACFNPDQFNGNPRCALAIEVVHSGSAKHILGDITNASMMGLYGIVIPSEKMEAKVKSIYKYVEVIRDLGKAPTNLFRNVRIIPQKEFLKLVES